MSYKNRDFFGAFRDKTRFRLLFFLIMGVVCLTAYGCISRTLEIKTNPPGARVFVEGEEIGRSPAVYLFNHYGPRDLLITLETQEDESVFYAPIRKTIELEPPWWCYCPIDFFVDILPFTVTDKHEASYTLVNSTKTQKSLEQIQRNMNTIQNKLIEKK